MNFRRMLDLIHAGCHYCFRAAQGIVAYVLLILVGLVLQQKVWLTALKTGKRSKLNWLTSRFLVIRLTYCHHTIIDPTHYGCDVIYGRPLLEPPVFVFVAVMAMHSRQESRLSSLFENVMQSLIKFIQFSLVLSLNSIIGTCEGVIT